MAKYWYVMLTAGLLGAACGSPADSVKEEPRVAPTAAPGKRKASPQSKAQSEDESTAAHVKNETQKNEKGFSKRPNVVVVLLDTLRPDYLGFMGNAYETAPFLAELAAKSAVFEKALSTSSWTAPSVASLFTGVYPPQHTVVQGFRAHRGMIAKMKQAGDAELIVNHIPSDLMTLPEMFEKVGYRTFGLTANINIGKEIGFSRGFERFEKHVKAPAENLYDILVGWREDIVQQLPFFLYLHFNDPHTPYHQRMPYFKPAESRKEDTAARYRSEIGYVDQILRKAHHLPGLSENTVWVFVSDHGEEFWDHGSTEHGPTLYGELQHVLMMIHGPSQGIRPGRLKENTSLIDILPTLAALIDAPLEKAREGVSLLPLLRGVDDGHPITKRLKDRCLFGHRMYSSRRKLAVWSVTCGRFKLIDWWGDRRKLFDHSTDRGEYYDLVPKRPKTAEELYSRLDRFRARMDSGEATTEQNEIALDKTLLEKLRRMGYVE